MTRSNLTVPPPAWQQFVENRQVNPAVVPKIVIDSWF